MAVAAPRRGVKPSPLRRISSGPAAALGMAIAGAVTLLDLDLVVIGGGVAGAGPLLFEPLATRPTRRYAALGFAAAPRVVPAAARCRAPG